MCHQVQLGLQKSCWLRRMKKIRSSRHLAGLTAALHPIKPVLSPENRLCLMYSLPWETVTMPTAPPKHRLVLSTVCAQELLAPLQPTTQHHFLLRTACILQFPKQVDAWSISSSSSSFLSSSFNNFHHCRTAEPCNIQWPFFHKLSTYWDPKAT